MGISLDIFHHSLIKHDEELCGDVVEVIRLQDSTIIVLSDGLGSGVKANILGTLTSKIAGTMLREGADIYETVDTIVKTLPVCKIRGIAYSTFTLIKIDRNGKVYMAEYDNPPFFLIRNGVHLDVEKQNVIIHGKTVSECSFMLSEGDFFTIVSDGVTHAGLGDFLSLGWKWENIKNRLQSVCNTNKTAKDIVRDLLGVCTVFDSGQPGDDTTVLVIKADSEKYVDLMTGPPKNPQKDSESVRLFMKGRGRKVICGGTTANIVSRELGKPLNVTTDYESRNIPPTATMEGIDLVTEGVLTLNVALERIREYSESLEGLFDNRPEFGNDGASRLARLLTCECSHLHLWVGTAVNPAHQDPDFPYDLSIKMNIVNELKELLESIGKNVTIDYL